MKHFLLKSYFLLLTLVAIFSFVLTDPNLVLLKADWFVNFQTYLWKNFLPLQNLRTIGFLLLMLALFANYFLIIKNWSKLNLDRQKNFWLFLITISLPLVLSYNGLSHDLFNYIFNAKMVVEFEANPHIKVALDFADEPMLRFMNNTHTPAPYGYGWTALSLLPYVAGFGKFVPTFFIFKLFALLSLFLTLLVAERFFVAERGFKVVNYRQLALFFFNPLVLIEILSSAHNDLWMLAPALLALYLAKTFADRRSDFLYFLIVALTITLLMAVSISIKFATLLLLPFIIFFLLKRQLERWPLLKSLINKLRFNEYIFDWMSVAMFLPLFTERSKQFLPWYLLWSLIFLPWLKNSWWRHLLLVFSVAALLRYLPWFYYIPWMSFHLDTSSVEVWQKMILWSLPAIYLVFSGAISLVKMFRKQYVQK